ncbi:amidohydrolase family protein [Sphingomonas sp. LB2R24]
MAVLHLIHQAIPSRFPRLRFIVPHFGGVLPMPLQRLDGQMPRSEIMIKSPGNTARRFYYDTVGWGSRAALQVSIEAFGASQIVTGSDYPIVVPLESYAQSFDHIRDSGFEPQVIDVILGNAARLLAEKR